MNSRLNALVFAMVFGPSALAAQKVPAGTSVMRLDQESNPRRDARQELDAIEIEIEEAEQLATRTRAEVQVQRFKPASNPAQTARFEALAQAYEADLAELANKRSELQSQLKAE